MTNEELITLARKQFRDSPGWDLGVNPDSIMDVHRRLADALEVSDAVIADALREVNSYGEDPQPEDGWRIVAYTSAILAPTVIGEAL